MENPFEFKYRLYFRTNLTSFSQCKDVLYTNDIEKVYRKINNIQGYDEYMLITNTENGPITERNPLDRPKMLIKVPKY